MLSRWVTPFFILGVISVTSEAGSRKCRKPFADQATLRFDFEPPQATLTAGLAPFESSGALDTAIRIEFDLRYDSRPGSIAEAFGAIELPSDRALIVRRIVGRLIAFSQERNGRLAGLRTLEWHTLISDFPDAVENWTEEQIRSHHQTPERATYRGAFLPIFPREGSAGQFEIFCRQAATPLLEYYLSFNLSAVHPLALYQARARAISPEIIQQIDLRYSTLAHDMNSPPANSKPLPPIDREYAQRVKGSDTTTGVLWGRFLYDPMLISANGPNLTWKLLRELNLGEVDAIEFALRMDFLISQVYTLRADNPARKSLDKLLAQTMGVAQNKRQITPESLGKFCPASYLSFWKSHGFDKPAKPR